MMATHEALDEALNARRLALRLRWRDVSNAAGVSYETLRGIRRGDYKPTELTARGLDDALRWAPGSTLAVLNGGAPVTLEEQAGEERSSARATASPDLAEELGLAQRLLASTLRELRLSPAEVDEVWRRVRLEIEQDHMATDEDDSGRSGDQGRAV